MGPNLPVKRVFNRLRHSARLLAAALCLAPLTAAVSAQTTVRVGGNTEPIIVAQAKGWFDEAGLKVEVTDVANFMQYPNMLASGSIDVLDGYLPANFWNMVQAGAGFKIIAGSAMAVAARNGEPARNIRGYVVRKDLYDSGQITKIKDLSGRRLADFAPVPPKGKISPFPIGHIVFGDVFKEIDWVRMQETDILAALSAKTIDGARMRTRFVKIAVDKGLAVELAKETDYVSPIQVRVLVVRDEFLRQHPDAAAKFLRAYLKAQSYVREVQRGQHKDDYLQAIKAHSNIPPEIALELVQELAFTADLAKDDIQRTQEHFVMVGAQKEVVPLEKVYEPKLLEAARK